MTTHETIRKLLHLKDLKITDIVFKTRANELHIYVKPYKNGCLCPKCLRRGTIVSQAGEPRRWRDICVGKWQVIFFYCPRDIHCVTHGRIQELIAWSGPYARVTYRLEFLVLMYSMLMAQSDAARLLHLPSSTFSDILHRTLTRIRKGHRIRRLRMIGIDEFSYRKGHKYVTIVYDLERSCVVWVGEGKARETIDRFFREELSEPQRKQIEYASCDMSETFIGAIKQYCPNAQLVLDRFHIAKALNEAVDEVRKEEWRKLSGDERRVLKGLRWLILKHSSNRTKRDTRLLNLLKKGNYHIFRAWLLKDKFEHFWDYQYPEAAHKFLKKWCTEALKSRLQPLRKFVKTIRKHQDDILTFVDCRLTNATAEGLNRKIRLLKNRASGFRSLRAFIDLIYLVVGDMDILNHIPAKHHLC